MIIYTAANTMQHDAVYRVVTVQQWKETQKSKNIKLSAIDVSFIHLATKEEVPIVLKRFFRNENVVVIELDPKKLGGTLKYEVNRGGTHAYPHLYDADHISKRAIIKWEVVNQSGLKNRVKF